jgi:hypothetical protein
VVETMIHGTGPHTGYECVVSPCSLFRLSVPKMDKLIKVKAESGAHSSEVDVNLG